MSVLLYISYDYELYTHSTCFYVQDDITQLQSTSEELVTHNAALQQFYAEKLQGNNMHVY